MAISSARKVSPRRRTQTGRKEKSFNSIINNWSKLIDKRPVIAEDLLAFKTDLLRKEKKNAETPIRPRSFSPSFALVKPLGGHHTTRRGFHDQTVGHYELTWLVQNVLIHQTFCIV